MGIIHRIGLQGDSSIVINVDADRIVNSYRNDDRLGLFLAENCARHMDAFVPMDTGALAQNFITKPFKITYTSLYAHRQYHGTNFHFSTEQHPLATSEWDKAMWSAKSNQIAREVQAYLRRRNP